jgi:hypothetical protein
LSGAYGVDSAAEPCRPLLLTGREQLLKRAIAEELAIGASGPRRSR